MTAMAQILSEEEIAQFHRDGFYVARGLFAPEEVAEIREAFMEMGKDGPVKGMSDGGHTLTSNEPLARWPRMMHPHRHPEFPVGPLATRYMLDERVHGILRDLFGEEPVAAQSMFYFKPPGARGQDFHQDNFYLRVAPGTCMAAWLAVDDADQENGGMQVVPGSNHIGIVCPEQSDSALFFTKEHVPVPEGLEKVPMDLKSGDMLFFNGSLIHGSYPNTSKDRFRCAFICHYVPEASTETSHWYRPYLKFDGSEADIDEAIGGGPCGTVQEIASPH